MAVRLEREAYLNAEITRVNMKELLMPCPLPL